MSNYLGRLNLVKFALHFKNVKQKSTQGSLSVFVISSKLVCANQLIVEECLCNKEHHLAFSKVPVTQECYGNLQNIFKWIIN